MEHDMREMLRVFNEDKTLQDARIAELHDTLLAMHADNAEKTIKIQELVNHVTYLSENAQNNIPPSPSSSSSHIQELKLQDPDYYNGATGKLSHFITQVNMVVNANPSRFPTPYSEVLYTCNLLRGAAFDYVQPMVDMDVVHPTMANLRTFFNALRAVFGDSDPRATSERALRTLTHTTSVSAYAIKFRQHTQLLGWNDASLIYHFHTGLQSTIKDELARDMKPTSFDAYVALAIYKENRIEDRNLERASYSRRHPFSPFTSPLPTPLPRQNPLLPPPGFTSGGHPVPMDIDATRTKTGGLTPEERNRRYDLKLCMYCGAADHAFLTCPTRRQTSKNAHPASS